MNTYKVTFQIADDYSLTDLETLTNQINDLLKSTMAPALNVQVSNLEVKKARN